MVDRVGLTGGFYDGEANGFDLSGFLVGEIAYIEFILDLLMTKNQYTGLIRLMMLIGSSNEVVTKW